MVDFSWISCLENGSKKVNLPIFAVLNMLEPALDEENRTVVTCLRWLPNTMWIHTKSTGLFQKKSKPNRWQGWRRHGISKGIEERGNSRGQLKKNLNFHRSVYKKLIWNDSAVIRKMFDCLVWFTSFTCPSLWYFSNFRKLVGQGNRLI